MPIDPSLIDVEGMKEAADASIEFVKTLQNQKETSDLAEQTEQTTETQALAEKQDPRNKEN